MELQRGANTAIGAADVVVAIGYAAPAGTEADASAYLLAENGKVRGDHDMVFFNQALGGGDAVRFTPRPGAGGSFEVALGKLPRRREDRLLRDHRQGAGRGSALQRSIEGKEEPKAGAALASYRPDLQGRARRR